MTTVTFMDVAPDFTGAFGPDVMVSRPILAACEVLATIGVAHLYNDPTVTANSDATEIVNAAMVSLSGKSLHDYLDALHEVVTAHVVHAGKPDDVAGAVDGTARIVAATATMITDILRGARIRDGACAEIGCPNRMTEDERESGRIFCDSHEED